MKFWNQHLTIKVASSFLFLSLVTVGVVGGFAFLNAKEAAFERLSAAATLKEEEITRWFEDQERDFLLVTQFPDVQNNFQILLNSQAGDANYRQAYKILSDYLANMAKIKPSLGEISILDRSNRIILSTNKQREGQYEISANITYIEQIQLGDSFAPIFYTSPISGKPSVTFATSIRDATKVRQGVLLADLNLDRIDRIVRERTGLGKSGETYLVGSLVTKNAFISKDQDKTQTPDFSQGVSSQGIDAAMSGISGQGLYPNYAGVLVIGYITKPFSEEEVFARVENNLTIRRLQKQLTEQNILLQQEISDRQKAESALRLSQFYLDKFKDSIFFVNSDAQLIYVNEAACRHLGYSRAQLLTMTVYDINPNFSTVAWRSHWQEVRQKGSLTFESTQRTQDGQDIAVEITVNYLELNGQEYHCASVRNITSC